MMLPPIAGGSYKGSTDVQQPSEKSSRKSLMIPPAQIIAKQQETQSAHMQMTQVPTSLPRKLPKYEELQK
jgi:hypothetical protein